MRVNHWRRLVCAVLKHDQVTTVWSAQVKQPGTDWHKVSTPGPPMCKRCTRLLGTSSADIAPGVRLSLQPDPAGGVQSTLSTEPNGYGAGSLYMDAPDLRYEP